MTLKKTVPVPAQGVRLEVYLRPPSRLGRAAGDELGRALPGAHAFAATLADLL